MMGRAAQTPGLQAGLHAVREHHASALSRYRPHQGAAARHQYPRRVRRAADLSRLGLRQRLQPVRPHLPRGGAGAGRSTAPTPRTCSNIRVRNNSRRYGAARRFHHRAQRHRALPRAALQSLSGGRARRFGGARLQPGPGDPDHAEARGADAAGRLLLRMDDARLPADPRRQHLGVRLRARRSCSCSWCSRRSSRA